MRGGESSVRGQNEEENRVGVEDPSDSHLWLDLKGEEYDGEN